MESCDCDSIFFNLFKAQIPELSLSIVRLNCGSQEKVFINNQSKGFCLRCSFYVELVEQQALREARVLGFEWISYDHKFRFLSLLILIRSERFSIS